MSGTDQIWHAGGCHCGAVRFETALSGPLEAQTCNCSMCEKVGFIHIIVPESRFRLTFSFGRNQIFTPNANPQNMPVTPRLRSQSTGPVWYRRMDRNLDGDITWREFLGSREQFDRLDRNADQMIDLSEASETTEPQAGKNSP